MLHLFIWNLKRNKQIGLQVSLLIGKIEIFFYIYWTQRLDIKARNEYASNVRSYLIYLGNNTRKTFLHTIKKNNLKVFFKYIHSHKNLYIQLGIKFQIPWAKYSTCLPFYGIPKLVSKLHPKLWWVEKNWVKDNENFLKKKLSDKIFFSTKILQHKIWHLNNKTLERKMSFWFKTILLLIVVSWKY